MTRKDEQELLRIIQSLSDASTRINDSIRNLMEIAKLLDERLTRLENAK